MTEPTDREQLTPTDRKRQPRRIPMKASRMDEIRCCLRAARQMAGLTAQEAAMKAGTHKQWIIWAERHGWPTLRTVQRVEEATGQRVIYTAMEFDTLFLEKLVAEGASEEAKEAVRVRLNIRKEAR